MSRKNKMHKWTLMFFLAGDNDLSPSMISELKAIKDAGFQQDTAVLVHFDPNEAGAPTRIFNVNKTRKERSSRSQIGDNRDPFVRNLKDDIIEAETIAASAGVASKAMKAALADGGDGLEVKQALELFLGFCRENHAAENYILFLVGHGLIVANDAFLPDAHPLSSLTLLDLDDVLGKFADQVRDEGSEFQLLSMHSCSMSALEVAYQLKDTANYMIATEGPSFIGSWPYRQLLKKIFNAVEREIKSDEVPELIEDIYDLSLFNSVDFTLAGYSQDLALCSLRGEAVNGMTEPLRELVRRLKEGLRSQKSGERVKEMLILAHWKAQSYWMESYTDLFDFCRCLGELCDEKDKFQASLKAACEGVMDRLYPNSTSFVLRSEHFGSSYQYSHGLSVYFPWSRPIETVRDRESRSAAAKRGTKSVAAKRAARQNGSQRAVASNGAGREEGILQRYSRYDFTTALGDDSWLSFLEAYFDGTMRHSRFEEDHPRSKARQPGSNTATDFNFIRQNFDATGILSEGPGKTSPSLGEGPGKSSPSVGVGCDCPSIKNYPREKIEDQGRTKQNVPAFDASPGALKAL